MVSSVSVGICFNSTAKGMPATEQSNQLCYKVHSITKKQMDTENTVSHCITPTGKNAKSAMIFHPGSCHLKLVTPQLAFTFVCLDN